MSSYRYARCFGQARALAYSSWRVQECSGQPRGCHGTRECAEVCAGGTAAVGAVKCT